MTRPYPVLAAATLVGACLLLLWWPASAPPAPVDTALVPAPTTGFSAPLATPIPPVELPHRSPGDVAATPAGPDDHSVPTTDVVRISRRNHSYAALFACFREAGEALPEELELPRTAADELERAVSACRAKLVLAEQHLSDTLMARAVAKHAAGGCERYDPGTTPASRAATARAVAPRSEQELTAYFVRPDGNYVARFHPGEDPELDAAREGLRNERLMTVSRIRALLAPHVPR